MAYWVSLIRFKWEMVGVLLLSITAAGIRATLAHQVGIVDITAALKVVPEIIFEVLEAKCIFSNVL